MLLCSNVDHHGGTQRAQCLVKLCSALFFMAFVCDSCLNPDACVDVLRRLRIYCPKMLHISD